MRMMVRMPGMIWAGSPSITPTAARKTQKQSEAG